MKLQRIFAMTAVAAFALSTLTGCPWEQEDGASSAPSSSSSRPSHDSDNDSGSDDSAPDTPSSTPEDEEGIIKGDGFTFNQTTNTYTVENEKGLQAWANFAKDNPSTNCTLEENITMSGNASLLDHTTSYTGTFDGQGHTISNVIKSLFDTIGSGGTVKNLTIGGEISDDGGIAKVNCGDIVNCTIEAAVISDASSSYVGGITRSNWSDGKIIGCVVTGTVSGGSAGGIVAHGTADASCYYSGTVTLGQYGIKNDAGTPVTGGWTDIEIKAMNTHLTDCEYVFELDNGQPKLVKRNSAEQAVNRLLAQFWG